MSARRSAAKASVQQTAPARTQKQSSGGGSKVIPRKRAHEQLEASRPESASDKSTPVAALRDDDTLLRVKQGSPSKRVKDDTPSSAALPSEVKPRDSEEEDGLDTTASQQQRAGTLTKPNLDKLNSAPRKIDFTKLIAQMVTEQLLDQGQEDLAPCDIFRKKPFLSIETLQNTGTPHLLQNKTSDKFTRRDIQFYDMYVKRESEEEVARLLDHQYPLEIGAGQYYGELEVDDFNQLFWN